MKKYEIHTKVLGTVQTNVYIIINNETKECIIIDPADEADKIIGFIQDRGLRPLAVLLTHGHFDHIGAAMAVKDRYDLKIYVSEAENELIRNPLFNVSLPFTGKGISLAADILLKDEEELDFLDLKWKVITSPGHTRGSVCYFIESENILFSGDTVFRGTCGRCDLYSGDYPTIKSSIINKLFILPEEVLVYPGHGQTTTIGFEKKYNEIFNY